VGANYRAACRGKSAADVVAKLGIVEEEADETLYWLELLAETGILPAARLESLRSEANGILSMTVASIKTLRSRGSSASSAITISSRPRPNPKSQIKNPK
jgi:four helix bundle protein